ncbi:hypothetical protein L227DRAFT_589710 [Lentinus tigrinus ALCF2SS1-6]|uniref:Uncharacterized protein n=1 Tax=Lentinus tigrinus ALCF2SS1-6 TaxID=1328759 RepID=A0A5C2RL53_9APHY|nr:hypothetical protein L227DRAFT_589710 [Lentinus tigrinus ALCF2SS1-6]
MPVFEGLLPLRDDQIIADLLFECANWHALAKLRLHTDGELEHRHVKRFYVRTNKIRYVSQLASKNRNGFVIRKYRRHDHSFQPRREALRQEKDRKVAAQEALERAVPPTAASPTDNAVPASPPPFSRNARIRVYNWLAEHQNDPATQVWIRISSLLCERLSILDDNLFEHRIIRCNYTTYDMRRDQDSINARTHPDVMLRASSDDDSHPFVYARVLKILHADVCYTGPGATSTTRRWRPMEVLWVRWFEVDSTYDSGFQRRRLPRVQFVDVNNLDVVPFGFVDPEDVIRASYLMPAFDHGETNDLLGPSTLARRAVDEGADFLYHYVCM